MSTPQQRKQIYALFFGKGLSDRALQRSIIGQYSDGRTTSATELTKPEAQALIDWLRRQPTSRSRSEKMRKKLIHYAHLIGWKRPDGRADMDRINEWCRSYGRYKKPLNDHSYEELVQLLSQFESTMKSYLTNI